MKELRQKLEDIRSDLLEASKANDPINLGFALNRLDTVIYDLLKESERLSIQAKAEDNDLKSQHLRYKANRAQRYEDFEEDILPKLEAMTKVEKRENGSFTFHTLKFGRLDFFPKSNKVLKREGNKWITNGKAFIVSNLIDVTLSLHQVASMYGSMVQYEILDPSGQDWIKSSGKVDSRIIRELEQGSIRNCQALGASI